MVVVRAADLSKGEIEREIRREGNRPSMGLNGVHPDVGVADEALGRYEDDRNACVDGCQHEADQPHIVEQRQPRDAFVAGTVGVKTSEQITQEDSDRPDAGKAFSPGFDN